MDRRAFIGTLTGGLLAAPLAAEGQPGKIPKIGVISGGSPNDDLCAGPLRQGLSELGYVEGRTHVLELRYAEGATDVYPRLAADLVRLKVDLIVSAAGPAAQAVKEATRSIPIVLASSFYPVELGVSRVALLRLPGRANDLVVRDMEVAARRLGIQLQILEVRRVEDLTAAFAAAGSGRAQAVMSTLGPFFFQNGAQIAGLAIQHRQPLPMRHPHAGLGSRLRRH
jgi:putative ABC transport system substrate-binding protein